MHIHRCIYTYILRASKCAARWTAKNPIQMKRDVSKRTTLVPEKQDGGGGGCDSERVCVRDREREREGVCVCVCVCAAARCMPQKETYIILKKKLNKLLLSQSCCFSMLDHQSRTINVYIYIFIYKCVEINMLIYLFICIYVCCWSTLDQQGRTRQICVYIYVYIYIHTCISIYIHTYMYTCIDIHIDIDV